jgi:hypothetical protein
VPACFAAPECPREVAERGCPAPAFAVQALLGQLADLRAVSCRTAQDPASAKSPSRQDTVTSTPNYPGVSIFSDASTWHTTLSLGTTTTCGDDLKVRRKQPGRSESESGLNRSAGNEAVQRRAALIFACRRVKLDNLAIVRSHDIGRNKFVKTCNFRGNRKDRTRRIRQCTKDAWRGLVVRPSWCILVTCRVASGSMADDEEVVCRAVSSRHDVTDGHTAQKQI